MLKVIDFKMPGPYHINHNIECQDSYDYEVISDNLIIAAVADGLGSCKHSAIGSSISTKRCVQYCKDNYKEGSSKEEIKKILNNAFVYAYQDVIERAKEDNNPLGQYDTTLCAAIFDGTNVYYANSGDSGIVALGTDGYIKALTRQQRDEDGNVFPLCCGPSCWDFGVAKNIHSLMLVTDGIYNEMVPPVLNSNNDGELIINIPNAYKFLNRQGKEDIDALKKTMYDYIKNYPDYQLNDDKTMVLIWNTKNKSKTLDKDYYKPIDWNSVYEKLHQKIKEDYKLSSNSQQKNSEKDVDDKPKDDNDKCSKDDFNKATTSTKNNPKRLFINPKSFSNVRALLASKSFNACLLIGVVMFSLLMWLENDIFIKHSVISYGMLFVLCFMSNASVLLPSSSLIIVAQSALSLNPFLVGIIAGFACSVGELVSYLAGYSAINVLKSSNYKTYNKIIKAIESIVKSNNKIQSIWSYLKNHPYLLVFLFALIPLPLFDFVGIYAGLKQLNAFKYFTACLLGKTIKCLAFALTSNIIIQFVN